MSYKLDAEQRERANALVEQIIDDPESFAFEIIWLRDNRNYPASLDHDQMGKLLLATRQALRDLLPWAKGCTTKNKERAAAVRRAEEVLLQNNELRDGGTETEDKK